MQDFFVLNNISGDNRLRTLPMNLDENAHRAAEVLEVRDMANFDEALTALRITLFRLKRATNGV